MEDKKNIIIVLLVIVGGFLGYKILTTPSQQSLAPVSTGQVQQTDGIRKNDCISAKDSWNKVGVVICVEYYVGNAFRSSKGNIFLNEKRDYQNGFTATIFANDASKFNNPLSAYGSKTIQVTGLIKMYQEHPEIIVNNPSDIVIVQ